MFYSFILSNSHQLCSYTSSSNPLVDVWRNTVQWERGLKGCILGEEMQLKNMLWWCMFAFTCGECGWCDLGGGGGEVQGSLCWLTSLLFCPALLRVTPPPKKKSNNLCYSHLSAALLLNTHATVEIKRMVSTYYHLLPVPLFCYSRTIWKIMTL